MPDVEHEPGAYTIKGADEVTGKCAGCHGQVLATDAYVIRYHATLPGGIFHQRCEPKGEGWYDVTGEAPDV